MHLAEVGEESAISAIRKMEENNGAIKAGHFKGAEGLIPPDIRTLLDWGALTS